MGIGRPMAREHRGRLTTPHKLQAEARSRKRAGRRLGVFVPRKPMAEACQLHAVVSRQRNATALKASVEAKVLFKGSRP